jgi:DNA polymerase-3 subunit epsilon
LIDQTKPKTGVYYLHNNSGRVIYIGKSLNMRKRVRQHLLGNDKKSLKLQLETKSVSCEETGSELIALLKEMNEIKKLSPKHNKKHKNQNLKFGIEQGIKSNGYNYLRISHYHDEVNYIYTFKNINNARKFLLKKSLEYKLCLNYMGIEPDEYECSNYKLNKCLGACIKNENQKSFNERMNNFIKKSHFNSPNLLLIDKGRRNDEKSIILIIDFKLYGYGFADLNYQIRNIETIKNIITKVNHSNYANNLVKQFIRKNRLAQIINLDDKT